MIITDTTKWCRHLKAYLMVCVFGDLDLGFDLDPGSKNFEFSQIAQSGIYRPVSLYEHNTTVEQAYA